MIRSFWHAWSNACMGVAVTAGAFGTVPARMHHFGWTTGETEVQVHGMGPFKLVYVNPADDPTKAAAKK